MDRQPKLEKGATHYGKGVRLYSSKRFFEALLEFKKAEKMGMKEAMRMEGLAYLALGEFEDAAKCFERYLNIKESAEAHFMAFLSYLFMDDGRMVKHIEKAFKMDKELVLKLMEVVMSKYVNKRNDIGMDQKLYIKRMLSRLKSHSSSSSSSSQSSSSHSSSSSNSSSSSQSSSSKSSSSP